MLKDMFRKPKYVTIKSVPAIQQRPPADDVALLETNLMRKELPDGLWLKCPKCGDVIFNKNLEDHAQVCMKCKYHFPMSARQRLALLVDQGTFEEWTPELTSADPLEFPGYKEKLAEIQAKTNLLEGVITGQGKIENLPAVLVINEGSFIMGSMGSAVGEKITRSIEKAIELQLPIIMVSTSGGARMQEGILSLYQMAKTSAALERFNQAGLLYISILTNPTYGGVTASYAMLGDIIIAEPGALIGFTGPNIIKQTMKKELPQRAQTAEFNQEHGFVDLIIERSQIRSQLAKILGYHRREA
ncbi:MAG: acetyl-CoA carboxylase, carboxyltransferase subunit beta [Peptococcaceae bacterium]|jgi:acetyl-CoA carboxylase carboxyl transferase subunit beta|nr:acetyl-CoA carboxylase, carboxyltransferase subunit beta [Peptococcaceae bacterium]